jgi:hypothetical protein
MQATVPKWSVPGKDAACHRGGMAPGGVFLTLILLVLAWSVAATLVVVRRGGRGPADPPASRPRTDPAGFPVAPAPRGILQPRARRRRDVPGAPSSSLRIRAAAR